MSQPPVRPALRRIRPLMAIMALDHTRDFFTSTGFNSGDTDQDNLLDVNETWHYTASHAVTQAELDAAIARLQTPVVRFACRLSFHVLTTTANGRVPVVLLQNTLHETCISRRLRIHFGTFT